MNKKPILGKKTPAAYTHQRHHCELLERRTLLTGTISFAPHVDFTAGTSPQALVAADFNGDGNEDLAVADHTGDKVSIFFGNGDGGFSAGPVLALSAPPVSIITGDFNGDGKPDLAVAASPAAGSTATTVTVFLNTGSSTFGLGEITTVETTAVTNEAVGLAAGDFNDDNKLDLAVTDFTTQNVSILFGNGNGTFQTAVNYQTDGSPTAITEADFNDDGLPDLAVTATTLNSTGQTISNQLLLLLDSSTGDFSAGADISLGATGVVDSVAVANLTATATPGLIVGNTDGTAALVTNTGGAFAEAATPTLAGGATSVASADFDLDGNADLVSANGNTTASAGANSVTVVPGLGAGTVGSPLTFAVGTNPADVVVADFNNDGKPDIATANEGGTVSILLNNTALSLISTRSTLVADSTSTPAGSAVTLTDTVAASSVSPLTGELLPTGTVNFYDGTTLLGSATIAAGTDQAVYSTSDLTIGTHRLKAVYLADNAYAGSSAAAIAETITPTAADGPDLVGTLVSTTFPAQVAPGETGSVTMKISNQGNTPATGSITNSVYLSLDNLLDGGDAQVPAKGSLAHTKVNLKPGQSETVTGTLTLPLSAPVATYLLLVEINATNSLAESTTANNLVVSPTTYSVSDVFGTVEGRRSVALQVADNNGITGTFKLTGPGNGTINVGDDGVDLVLDGTTTASTLTITTRAGSFDLHDITADSAIGTIRGTSVNVSDSISLPSGATAITLNSLGTDGVVGNSFNLGTGAATITVSSVSDENLTTSGGIKSLSVGNWDDGSITAGWIGTLRSKQNFGAALQLSGAGAPRGLSLTSATVGGTIGNGSNAWDITGNVGRIAAAGYAGGWDLTAGLVTSISSTDDFSSTISASGIASILIRGSLLNATISATGPIGVLKVGGGATASTVSSGLAAGMLQPGGSIHSISIAQAADPTSRFLAAALPKRVVIDGQSIDPATDPRFMI